MKKKKQIEKVQAQPAAVETVASEKKININRENLKKLSAQVKELVAAGEFKNVNAAIIATVYRNEMHQTFKSFNQWIAEGFRVRKGEKAFCIWGKPTQATKEDETYEFFPLSFLFSNAQVEPSKQEVQS